MTEDFFTPQTFGTLGTATVAVVMTTNVLRVAFRLISPLVPLAVSLVVGFAAAGIGDKLDSWVGWLLAILNSCLLFCTATGAQQTLVSATTPQVEGALTKQSRASKGPVRFLSPWLRVANDDET